MKGSARKVLVLEDEFFIADEIVQILEGAGYAVVGPASTVEDALGHIASDDVDAAVIDANLRGETSLPVAARLRCDRIPFVVCSGYRAEDLAPQFGSVALISKPVNSGRLVSAVEACIGAAGRGP